MRVTFGIPVYEHFKTGTTVSLLAALPKLSCEWALTVKRGPYIDTLREDCIRTALEHDSDVLMLIDTDMQFLPDALDRLLAHGKDVIGGAYNEKRFPLKTTVKLENPDGGFIDGGALPHEPFRCAAVATGFMAINLRRLVACMAPPYFEYETARRLELNASLDRAGEDVAFCVRARQNGLEVWCDPTISLGHIGEHVY